MPHQQVPLLPAIGLTAGSSLAAAVAANPSSRETVMAFGKLVYNQPSALLEHTGRCLSGIREQLFHAVSYILPPVKTIAERDVAIKTVAGPFQSALGKAGINTTGNVTLGTLGLAAAAPAIHLAGNVLNACQRFSDKGYQYDLINRARNSEDVNALGQAAVRLQYSEEHYRKLSERSVMPGWKSLLCSLMPSILLVPQLGASAIALGAVAGVSQIASNAWEKWANISMLDETRQNIKVANFSHRTRKCAAGVDALKEKLKMKESTDPAS
ncbi:hypothetical protein EZMO1_0687 [Endozoicomonas montiporae CL-33]|nr:hypothetical protein [Endozoicomonas montiporae]AMO54924.1 hypothetical protein EZMO1_0687 [Endozoicomonas montiporae CL-33]